MLCARRGCRKKISRGRYCTSCWKIRRAEIIKAGQNISRAKVWARDKGTCGICHKKANEGGWHLDHIKPLSRGGKHTYANVQVSHPLCNWKKGTKVFFWIT